MERAPTCALHPGAPAAEVCARCGAFACAGCLDGGTLCPACAALLPPPAWPVPWERRGELGLFSAGVESIRETVLSPAATYARLAPHGRSLWDPLTYALWAHLTIPLALLAVLSALGLIVGAVTDLGHAGVALLGLVALGLALPLAVAARVFALAASEHAILVLLSGARAPFEATVRAHCYAAGPALFALFPCGGPLLAELWAAALRVHALRAVHGTTTGRAVVAVAVPFAPLVVLAALLGLR